MDLCEIKRLAYQEARQRYLTLRDGPEKDAAWADCSRAWDEYQGAWRDRFRRATPPTRQWAPPEGYKRSGAE